MEVRRKSVLRGRLLLDGRAGQWQQRTRGRAVRGRAVRQRRKGRGRLGGERGEDRGRPRVRRAVRLRGSRPGRGRSLQVSVARRWGGPGVNQSLLKGEAKANVGGDTLETGPTKETRVPKGQVDVMPDLDRTRAALRGAETELPLVQACLRVGRVVSRPSSSGLAGRGGGQQILALQDANSRVHLLASRQSPLLALVGSLLDHTP